jgi:hypothetical protein
MEDQVDVLKEAKIKKHSPRRRINRELRRDYDQAWKIVVEGHLKDALDIFWPELGREIDWTYQNRALDKELKKINSSIKVKKQLVDMLFEFRLLSGEEVWILLHVEVQTKKDLTIAERVLQYLCCLKQKYRGRRIEQMLVLLDIDPNFRPDTYLSPADQICKLKYQFKTVKLNDWKEKLTFDNVHKAPKNIFNLIILLQLESMYIDPKDQRSTCERIKAFIRVVNRCGHTSQNVRDAIEFCGYVLRLSDPILLQEVDEETEMQKKTNPVAYEDLGVFSKISYNHGMTKGKTEGKIEGKLEGKIEGKLEGKIEGRLEGLTEAVIKIMQEGTPKEKALQLFNISLAEFEKGLKLIDLADAEKFQKKKE